MYRLSIILFISALLSVGCQVPIVFADSLSDDEAAIAVHIKALHDERSEVREPAAEALRRIISKYPSGTSNIRDKDGGEAYWKEKVKQVKPGMTKSEVLQVLPPLAEMPGVASIGSGTSHLVIYRLDYHWLITVHYRNPDKAIRAELNREEMIVYATPPKNYTGTWINWYVNGKKALEIGYTDGRYNGSTTRYYDNGKKMYEQQRTTGGSVAETGWTEQGVLRYKKQYGNTEVEK